MAEHRFETQLSNREFFIHRWGLEHPAFLDVCQALPPDRLDYRPHPGSRSAGELVALLVSLERSCVELCTSGKGSYNTTLHLHATSGTTTLEGMVAAYVDHHHTLAQKLNQLDD